MKPPCLPTWEKGEKENRSTTPLSPPGKGFGVRASEVITNKQLQKIMQSQKTIFHRLTTVPLNDRKQSHKPAA
jgi:hypothetical protein